MANTTPKSYRNQVLYSIFVRNYSSAGTFEGVRQDLDRIQALGTDIIWLMPIHPLGLKSRKGNLGSPYAIRDYRAINPEFGTLEDFRCLVDDIHAHGMKCIIDVVYNHTSPDSWLAQNHPEWFYHKPDGSFGNRVGDWTDIIDLDYSKPELWDYQIETLKMWAEIVDGFRCDVAPMVPLAFWNRARKEVETVRPGAFWLAESVEPGFILLNREQGITAHSDGELYQAFDCCYDYDIWDIYNDYIRGKSSLCSYAEAVNRQEGMYPGNYLKLRCLENHDRARAAWLFGNGQALRNWTAFNYFQKGLTMIYAGQEVAANHTPSLFDLDTIDWNQDTDLTALMKRLAVVKRDPIFTDSRYHLTTLPHDMLLATHVHGDRMALGIFSLRGKTGVIEVPIADGFYENQITGEAVEVYAGTISFSGEPIILFLTRN